MRIRNQEGVMNSRPGDSSIVFTVSRRIADDIMFEFMMKGRNVYQSMEVDYNPDLHEVKDMQNDTINAKNPWVNLTVWIYPLQYAEVVKSLYRTMQHLASMGKAFDLNKN